MNLIKAEHVDVQVNTGTSSGKNSPGPLQISCINKGADVDAGFSATHHLSSSSFI